MTIQMPKIQPVPIKTKGLPLYKQLWIWLTARREWQITEDWDYHRKRDEFPIRIPAGFTFNGVSSPRLLWGLFSPTGILFIPSLIHDYMYQKRYLIYVLSSGDCHVRASSRNFADWLFLKIANDVTAVKPVNYLAYTAVRLFGKYSWDKYKKEESSDAA